MKEEDQETQEEESTINKEKYEKYKEMFDKYKNKEGLISEQEVNEILNECGRKTTVKESEELIKKITRDTERNTINFENFVKLMDSEDLDYLKGKNKEKNEPKKISDLQLYGFMLLLLITGSINTIANKLQQNTVSLGIKYQGHQKFITFCMFNGELLCLLIYWVKDGRKKKKKQDEALISNNSNEENKKKQPKIWNFLFPALFDIVGSSINSISLTFLASSIYQMFRGAIIIFTCTAGIIFLKNKYYRHHFLGIIIAIMGLVVVGVNAIINKSSSSNNPGFGIFLCILSQMFSCFLFITEEKLLKGYETPPLMAVGFEGMWGVIVYLFLLVIFYQIRCEKWPDFLKEGICIEDTNDHTIRFENALFAIRQIYHSGQLKAFLSLYVLSIAFFNFSGLTISKNASATSRTIVDTLRTIVIWVFFLTMPFVPEDTKETFKWLQLLGFSILILGSLIYNEILVLPFCGFNANTKEAIKYREKRKKLTNEIEEKNQEKQEENQESQDNIDS